MKLFFEVMIALSFASSAFAAAPIAAVGGCRAADYVTVTGPAVITVTQTPSNFAYSPRCVKVAVGATVKIAASSFHPVQGIPTVGAGAMNPLVIATGPALTTISQVFTKAGAFGYFCTHHGSADGRGMAGSILVQ